MTKKTRKTPDENFQGGLGGLLGGFADLVQKLGELAEKGKELSGTGQLSDLGFSKDLKGVYGFNVRVGLGKDEDRVKVEPFGNIKTDKKSGQAVVQEVREPLVDVFEEEGHTLVVAEMPGISLKDVKLDMKDDVLTISAQRGDKKYRKEVLLPHAYPKDKLAVTCNNGMLEIKCVL